MHDGWISLHRKFLEWEWFADNNMVKLFIYLLLKANHSDNTWKGVEIKRGQLLTGLDQLNFYTKISIQTLRTCLKRLEKTKEINMQVTNKYRIITICNYDSYQQVQQATNKQTNKQLTSNQQTTNKQLTANNNVNKENNENNVNKSLPQNEFLQEREILNNVYNLFDFEIVKNLNENHKLKWLDTINKLNRIDNFDYSEIEKTITWGRNDEFWKSNFHAIPGLRKKINGVSKFFQINKKMNYEQSGKNGQSDKQIEDIRKIAERIANDPDLI